MRLEFMMELQVFAIERKLKKWMKPLVEISEEISLVEMPDVVFFKGEDTERVAFDKSFISTLSKTFKDGTWYLSQIKTNKYGVVLSRLLIIELPFKHYAVLAPKVFGDEHEEEEE